MPPRAHCLPLALLALLPVALASQGCSYDGPVPSFSDECMLGTNPMCINHQCMYEFCDQGSFAEVAFQPGTLFDDSPMYFYCHYCPGDDQTADDQDSNSSGIGECYVPCGPVKCYVPSLGGTKAGAYQTGAGICVNPLKGICEEMCDVPGHIPIPDAYSLNNTCILALEDHTFFKREERSVPIRELDAEQRAELALRHAESNNGKRRRYAKLDSAGLVERRERSRGEQNRARRTRK
ncbi:hypothetical protein CALVIDRAFT_539449 [Calocera viscosa TUFC12733]|uniref:Uncharacterized protein n=1 Tax=Calocera viscosa (strain TUFC12733) TaxID=1330018 RepID=A0A167JYJ9_CALVF|nr:hypothetical protein CALVIDRAFT_539449 [Calocera viscosa TUFC12733]